MKRSTKVRRRTKLGRRAETADETKRRIVEATFQLHGEQGIAATSMTDIARRAGVSVGTVYHHFPSYTDTIVACAAYTVEHAPAPTAAVFEGAASRAERIARLAQALFEFYERVPALSSVRRDRHMADVLDHVAREEVRNRQALAGEAVGADGARCRTARCSTSAASACATSQRHTSRTAGRRLMFEEITHLLCSDLLAQSATAAIARGTS
jgi:AcrR family transcriptional regulator